MKLKTLLASAIVAAATLLPSTSAMAQSETFTIDAVHSTVIWKVQHMGAGHSYGRFNELKGTITGNPADPATLSVDVTVPAASVDSANAKRDEHLKGPDFFNVAEFPNITFKSKSAKKIDAKSVELTGDLTLRGVTKEVKTVVNILGQGKDREGKKLIGGEATLTIKRGDFGITYGKGALGEDVTLTIALEAAATK